MKVIPRETEERRNGLTRLFDESFWDPVGFFGRDPLLSQTSEMIPAVDISENTKSVLLEADVPGFAAENIDVEVEGNTLTIKGKKEEEKEEEHKHYYRKERSYDSFQRSFTLPSYADMDKIDCESKNGKLRITVPKRKESAAKKIKVKS